MKGTSKCPEELNHAVYNGIRKTINRFRENPFVFFTESDIHASLSKDIMTGNSSLFITREKINKEPPTGVPISLVHHEYPTNFRYQSKKLKEEGYNKEEEYLTNLNSKHGDRGNFDLAVLNPEFINSIFSDEKITLEKALMEIINKDNARAKGRLTKEEGSFAIEEKVSFAIEVKFIHRFNAGNIGMITEVKKDNNKLDLALRTSNNFIKPINLIFCSTNYEQSNGNSVIKNIKDYLSSSTPKGVCAIFIQSYYKENKKITDKPFMYYNPIKNDDAWANELGKELKL
jgi:hypothetical protein